MNEDFEAHLTEEQLHAAAEATLAPGDRAAVDHHLAACESCRADVARIEALLASADALPRSVEPPEDLWPAIRSRVAGGLVVPMARPRREVAWLAAAALLLVVATSAITLAFVRDDRAVATTVTPGAPDDSIDGPSRFRAVSAEYDRLDRDLARRLDEHRAKLQPETIEKVERNLLIIDRAIGEIRQALAEDPHNEALEALLKASYGQKSALLQQVSQS